MEILESYLPMDRRQALAHGQELPEQVSGAALFADISGFTALTEGLTRSFGPRRGAEEVSRHLNAVYAALISRVDRYGGSVVGFAGDSITCWFGERTEAPPPARAAACALEMQAAMQPFARLLLPGEVHPAQTGGGRVTLAVKASIASGPARRLVVGNPNIQLLDTLAGVTIERMARAEGLTRPGEVVVDEPTARSLQGQVAVGVVRRSEAAGEEFTVVTALLQPVAAASWPTPQPLPVEQIRPWLIPAVYKRHLAGMGEFLTEFRPAVALFLRFTGIDFEAEEAGEKLDQFIRKVQSILALYEGALIQLNIGDKGSYLYASFGAPTAHEDDVLRAVQAGLDLAAIPDRSVQVGISQGTLLAGVYGGSTFRSYSIMGDDVNLAARLMQQAEPGQVLVSVRVQTGIGGGFSLDPLPPIPFKGKAEPLPVFAVSGPSRERAIRLLEPAYTLPMVGRQPELAAVGEKIELARQGKGQVVGITAGAGMGKSRLVAEAIRLARRKGLHGFGGACQSYGANTAYLAWAPIWQDFFDLDPEAPLRKQIRLLEGELEDLAPERVEALPLLGPLLNVRMAENDFTRALEPQTRKSALEALLVDCVRAKARQAGESGSGLLFVLEDLHWIDPASHDLLELIANSIESLPAFILLAYRPAHISRLQTPRVERLPYFTQIELAELAPADAEALIRAKLAQFAPESLALAPAALIERVSARAQGNPFYLEELLNYLRARGLDLRDPAALDLMEIPGSLQRLVLARLDQLTERQKVTVKVASVIGRLIRISWLHGCYPALGTADQVVDDLEAACRLDLTALEEQEPELAYLFRHIVTQEAAYESLSYTTRASLHEQLARYLENQAQGEKATPASVLDLLAYHYDHSENIAKRREYLERAGEAAAARYANVEAVDYFSRALDLAPESELKRRYDLLLARQNVYHLQGERGPELEDLEALAALAEGLEDDRLRCEVWLRRADYATETGDLPGCIAAAEKAAALARSNDDPARLSRADCLWGQGLWQQGNFAEAQPRLEESLALARSIGEKELERKALANLSAIFYAQGDFQKSIELDALTLTLARAIGNKSREGHTLGNMGLVADRQGDYEQARSYHEQSVAIGRLTGDRNLEAWALGNLAGVAINQGDYARARGFYEQSLALSSRTANMLQQGYVFGNLGFIANLQGDYEAADEYLLRSLEIARSTHGRNLEAGVLLFLGHAALGLENLEAAEATYRQAQDLSRELSIEQTAVEAQAGLASLALRRGDPGAGLDDVNQVLAYLEDHPADGFEEPVKVFLSCYRVLRAAGDPRAGEVLERGYAVLMARAEKIRDEAARRSFLENVPAHREVREERRKGIGERGEGIR